MLEHLTNKYDIEDMLTKFSYSVVKTGQIPSANGQCSARGIARVAAMLANRGELEVFVWYFDFWKDSLAILVLLCSILILCFVILCFDRS